MFQTLFLKFRQEISIPHFESISLLCLSGNRHSQNRQMLELIISVLIICRQAQLQLAGLTKPGWVSFIIILIPFEAEAYCTFVLVEQWFGLCACAKPNNDWFFYRMLQNLTIVDRGNKIDLDGELNNRTFSYICWMRVKYKSSFTFCYST